MKFEVEAPWGKFEGEGMLGWIEQCWHQLQHFKEQQLRSPEGVTEHLKRDIEGYEEIIKSGSEKNANEFMRIKHEAKDGGARFKDNMAIVEKMKKECLWE